VVACCGVTGLRAAGVAGVVLWSAGRGVAGAGVAALGAALYLRRRRACEECGGLRTKAMYELEHEGGRR
jgi:hypothetical protein